MVCIFNKHPQEILVIHRPGILRKSSSRLHGGAMVPMPLILTLRTEGTGVKFRAWDGLESKQYVYLSFNLETAIDLKCSSTYWLYPGKGWNWNQERSNQESDYVGWPSSNCYSQLFYPDLTKTAEFCMVWPDNSPGISNLGFLNPINV